MSSTDRIYVSIYSGVIEDAEKYTKEELERGTPWRDILKNSMLPALDRIGREYSEGQAYLPEMIAAGMATVKAIGVIKESVGDVEISTKGTILIGTVFGDLHDIGKNIVKLNLEAAGYRVIDLGIDVSVQTFLESHKKYKVDIIAISCLLSTTMQNLKTAVRYIREADPGAKILVGGNPVTAKFAEQIGADGYAPDGYLAVKKADELLGN